MTKKILILPWIMIILFALIYFVVIGKREKVLNEYEKAAYVIGQMVKDANADRSAFRVYYPGGNAKDFVEYIFSTPGSAEWPPSEDSDIEMTNDEAAAAGIIKIPKGFRYYKQNLNTGWEKQVVVKWNNEDNAIITEVYESPERPAKVIKIWKLK